MIVALSTLAVMAPYIAPYSYLHAASGPAFALPSWSHLLGTDNLGRDVFSGILKGLGTTILIGVSSAAIAALIGLFVGALAGYHGGLLDEFLMKITDFVQLTPIFFVALVIFSILTPSVLFEIVIIGALIWPGVARVLRSEIQSLREQDFVEAARASGARNSRIIFLEILPNALPSFIVNAALLVSSAILIESGLSFLGLGDQNAFSLGFQLSNAYHYVLADPWLPVPYGIFIVLIVLAFNIIGDGLIDALDPRTRRR